MLQEIIKSNRIFTEELSAHTVAVSQHYRNAEKVFNVGLDKVERNIIEVIREDRTDKAFATTPRAGNSDLSADDALDLLAEERLLCENSVLESLRFPTMNDRHEEIADAHKNTFKWMFEAVDAEDDSDLEAQSNNFVEWLCQGDGIYWINGKAGSGKSTLMRYIYHDHRTRQYLQSWASPHVAHIATFFFWNSGTSDQRSQRGLLRSLLYESLLHRREMIPVLLPKFRLIAGPVTQGWASLHHS